MSEAAVQKPWWQLCVHVPTRWAEDAAAALIEAGALGVQTLDDEPEPLPEFSAPPDVPLRSGQRAGESLLVATWDGDVTETAMRHATTLALTGLGLPSRAGCGATVERRADSDWAERWKQYFEPLQLGQRLWVVPSWNETFTPPAGSVTLILDPGMAFGTGQHATTALCARAVEAFADALPANRRASTRLLDLGCGTGILAIAASKLGIGEVHACDIDAQAVQAAQQNAAQNGVGNRLVVDATPVTERTQTYDFIVANILATPLVELAEAISGRLAPTGVLVLSGLLNEQAAEVQQAYEAAFLRLGRNAQRCVDHWRQGDWAALRFAPIF